MTLELSIFIFLVIVLAGTAYTLYARGKASIFSRSIIYACLAFILIVVSLFAYSQSSMYGTMRFYLDFKHGEFTPTSTFSSLLLFSIGLVGVLIAIFSKERKWWLTLHWLYIAGLFAFLSLDEYFAIHEFINHWERYYIAVAGLSALVSGAVFWKVYPKQHLLLYFVLYGSMAFAALGGVGIEEFTGEHCFELISRAACQETPILEEVFEMLGFTAALASLFLLAEQLIEPPKWQSLKKALTAISVVWLFILIFSYWGQPALENRFLATPVEARFADGQMTLTGYRINKTTLKPNEQFTVLLYWYVDNQISREYGYTVNLLHPITGESVARINSTIINPATTFWFVGTTHRTTLYFQLPEDIETPVSPNVVVTVWRKNGNTYDTLLPEETDAATFEGMPILQELSILSDEKPIITNSISYIFDNGAQIEGYTFSQNDNQIDMEFYWSSNTSSISTDLSQIMHLIHENGEDFFIFDRHPFSGAFPSRSWIDGMLETDTWQIEIPNDAPAGNYTLYTGLYNTDLSQRVAVTATDGNQLANNLIPIAEITVQ